MRTQQAGTKLALLTMSFGLTGCFNTPFSTTASISSGGGASTMSTTTDSSGRSTATYDPNANYAQQLVATSGDLAGTYVLMPPGSLSIPTTISLELGASLADGSAMADLGIATTNAIEAAGASVIIRPAENIPLLAPMSLSIPLPSGIGLTALPLADDAKLAILAKIFDEDGTLKSQLIPRSKIIIENGRAKFETKAFGAFQTIVLQTAVTEEIKVATQEPIANQAGVTVIATTGVVAATEIAKVEEKPALTFTKFDVGYDSLTRTIKYKDDSFALSEDIFEQSKCSLYVRDSVTKVVLLAFHKDDSPDSDKSDGSDAGDAGDSGGGARIPADISGKLEIFGRCEAPDGRIAISKVISIGDIKKAAEFGAELSPPVPIDTPVANADYGVLQISWQPAYDDATAESLLQYQLEYSETESTFQTTNPSPPPNASLVWTSGVHEWPVSGLTVGTTYFFRVSVMDLAGKIAHYPIVSKIAPAPDTTAPTFSAGSTITVSDITEHSATLTWNAASDDLTPPDKLQYKVAYAVTEKSSEIFSLEDKEFFADWDIGIAQDWTANLSSAVVHNLRPGNTYVFVVFVRDLAGMTTTYLPTGTVPTLDSKPPELGAHPKIYVPSFYQNANGEPTVSISVTDAWDDSEQPLSYKLVSASELSLIDTLDGANHAATEVIQNWTPFAPSIRPEFQVIGPVAEKAYAVIVKDPAGNMALYPPTMIRFPNSVLTSGSCWSDQSWFLDRTAPITAYITGTYDANNVPRMQISAEKSTSSDLRSDATLIAPLSDTASQSEWSQSFALDLNNKLETNDRYLITCTIKSKDGSSELMRLSTVAYVQDPPYRYSFEGNANNSGYENYTIPLDGSPHPDTESAVYSNGGIGGGKCLSLDGSYAIRAANFTNAIFPPWDGSELESYTLAGWFKPTNELNSSTGGPVSLMGFHDFIEVTWTSGSLTVKQKATDGTDTWELVATVALTIPMSWTHIAVLGIKQWPAYPNLYPESRTQVFINGNKIHDQTFTGTAFSHYGNKGGSGHQPFFIGGFVADSVDHAGASSYFTGLVDEIIVYPRAVSDGLIKDMATPVLDSP